MTVLSSTSRPFPALSVTNRGRERTESTVDPLVERARNGDQAAFQELFHTYKDTVARVVFRIMGPSSEIEDVVQDVFVHVFRSLHSFRGDAKFSTWLYRLASNVTKMHLRRKKSRPRFADVPIPERLEPGMDAPDEQIDRQKRVEALYRLVDRLSEKKREVLVLHDFEGLPAKEIAEIVDAPVLTVRTRLFYARKELYAALAEEPVLAAVVEQLLASLPGKPKKASKKKSAETKPTRSTRRRKRRDSHAEGP